MAVAATTISCNPGEYLNSSGLGCVQCPEKSYCNNNEKIECPESHPNSAKGAKSQGECYKTCNGTLEDGHNAYYNNQCKCVLNATRSGGTCTCNTGYQQSGNTCIPNIYEITLEKNLTNFLETAKKVYVKYGIGFATARNATNWNPNGAGVVPSINWWQQFSGYYTAADGGSQVFDNQGMITNGTNSKTFTSDTTLYGHWNEVHYFVEYYKKDGTTLYQKQTCTMNGGEDNCLSPETGPKVNGEQFSGWTCVAGCSGQIAPGSKVPEPSEAYGVNTPIKLKAAYSACPVGHYCDETGTKSCPKGSTTNGTGKRTINDCVIKRGNSGTKFCDSVGCFYLPGTDSIPY